MTETRVTGVSVLVVAMTISKTDKWKVPRRLYKLVAG